MSWMRCKANANRRHKPLHVPLATLPLTTGSLMPRGLEGSWLIDNLPRGHG
uniref:Uncharacterized protein n=1 Tax=Rhizophora mucronata TaxID=61149 RepID=A0A2P2MZ43_RHIMU